MNKYIIVGIVIIIGIVAVWFLVKNGGSFSEEFTQVGNNPSLTPENTQNSSNKTAVESETKPITNLDNKKMTSATLNTSMGSITIEFFDTQAPNTVANFIKLAKEGFYNKIKFHRVIKGFMIQGGDPLTKDDTKMALWGTGDPGYKFADEIDPQSDLYVKTGYKKGIVAMANSGPNTNGSQFFIMTADYPLPPLYTIFGKVISGQDVVDKIALIKTGANDRPTTPVVIESISLK